ncbi:shikimate dehydrogenase [Rurimicrobium arvi]|uniref:Shikimate dehydrogenase (NADP(+)) n=1 Tax=Rurimicrobium arvi TaxID=2049916 RepID=A0ABP8MKH7_9BACT
MNIQFGIIGKPLSHSFSPAYFNRRFREAGSDLHYEAFPLEHIGQLPELLRQHPGLRGLNVTLPYKTAVIPFLDYISESAKEIGAVNCIRIQDGTRYGYNTDVYGFRESLRPLLHKDITYKALVLGTGGSSKAVTAALRQLNIGYTPVSSSEGKGCAYAALTPPVLEEHLLIINTTPLGMWPDTGAAPPIPYEALGPDHLLFDLIYNPEETLFLQKGKQQGASVKNGLEMLLLQAERSWELWNDLATEPIVTV